MLKENENIFKNIVDLAPDGILTVDFKGYIVYANPAFIKLTGYQKEEIVGKHFTKLPTLRAKDIPQYIKMFVTMIKKDKIKSLNFIWHHKDGKERYGAARFSFLKEKGKKVGFQTICRDITEQKKAEEALIESEEKYRYIFEQSPIGIGLSSMDGKVISSNKAMEKITGYTINELRSIKLSDTYKDPQQRKLLLNELNKYGKVSNFHVQLKRKNNSIYDASLSISKVHINGKDFLQAMCIDITESKNTEEALRENKELFNLFMDHLPVNVFIKDDKSRALFVNEQMNRTFGAKQWIGKDALKLFPKIFAEKMISDDKNVLDKGFQKIEEVIPVKNKTLRFFETYKFKIARKNKSPLIGGIGLDITERKKAEEQIKRSLIEKEILIKEIHHRVKNNLQIISSLLSLQTKHIKDKKALEAFAESENRVHSMALIHNLLYRSKDISNISMKDYINSLVDYITNSYSHNSHVSVTIKVKDVHVDIDKLVPCGLIINELVSNIFKYAFPDNKKGTITISFHYDNKGHYILTISDNGIGIPKGFDIKRSESLGLTLVYTLTEQLDGKIKMTRNKGTKFTIRFPIMIRR
ncbi:PAS domain S-box protein [Spirochaetota bacterium]